MCSLSQTSLGRGVGLSDLGHVEVESGVVDRNVGQVGILLQAVLDNVGLGVVVQRRERGDLSDLGENVLVDEGGVAKVPTALNDTVANALDLDAVGLEVLQNDLDGDLCGRGTRCSRSLLEPLAAWVKVLPVKQTRLAGAPLRTPCGTWYR